MKLSWCQIKKFLTDKKVTPLQLILFVGMLMLFLFMSTNLFNNMPDLLKVLIYASGWMLSLFLGITGIGKILKVFDELRNIVFRRDITNDSKLNKLTSIIQQSCWMLGIVFEDINIEQGTDPRSEEQKKT